jgi:hypothetical protein
MTQTTKAITTIAVAKTIRKVLVSSAMGAPLFQRPYNAPVKAIRPEQLSRLVALRHNAEGPCASRLEPASANHVRFATES